MAKNKTQKTKFTKHALLDREERIVWIATEVGYGSLVDTIQIYDVERGYRKVELYETGVAVIRVNETNAIITMFLPTPTQLENWYGAKGSVPIHLFTMAKLNKKRGWTDK